MVQERLTLPRRRLSLVTRRDPRRSRADHGPTAPRVKGIGVTRTGHMALGGVVRPCIAFQDALALAKLQKNPSRTANKPMSKVGELGQSSPKAPAEDSIKDAVPIPFLSLPFDAKTDAIALTSPMAKAAGSGLGRRVLPSRPRLPCIGPAWPDS